MIVLAIFSILFGLFFALIGVKFTLKPAQTIRRLQEMKFKSSSEPDKRAVVITRVFGIMLLIIGSYFILIGMIVLIN